MCTIIPEEGLVGLTRPNIFVKVVLVVSLNHDTPWRNNLGSYANREEIRSDLFNTVYERS